MADKTSRKHSIYAVSYSRTDTVFPIVWARNRDDAVYAVNVTDRYAAKSEATPTAKDQIIVRFRVWNAGRTGRVAMPMEVRLATDQSSIGQGKSTGDQADMNDMLEMKLKRDTKYEIAVGQGDSLQTHPFKTDQSETQIVEIELAK